MRNFRRTGAALAALALIAAGCGDDDADDGAADTDDPVDVAGPDDETVLITAVDYAYEGVPDTVAAGTRLEMTNGSSTELHEIVVMRIKDGVDLTIDELASLPEGEVEQHLVPGPPVAVLVAPPGEEASAVPDLGDGTLSEPGRYALVCFIPTGADPDEYMDPANQTEDGPPQVDGGPPHIVNGMYAELTVE